VSCATGAWQDVVVVDERIPPLPSRPWGAPEPGRLLGKGHPAGDFLQAFDWRLLEDTDGFLRVSCDLPEHVKNPRGQLFGGFTPTYVDLIALLTVRAGHRKEWDGAPRRWLATTNMRIDYFEPIVGPSFVIESRLEKARGRTNFVTTRFVQAGEMAVYAVTTMREVAPNRPLGDA
jgi:acyl-coenzyme A thioesterase PaaI-like protein